MKVEDSIQQDFDKILRERAKIYSKKIMPEKISDETKSVSLFTLSDEVYGLETLYIKEVFQLENITKLPSTPDFLLGIINYRGVIVPVINLKIIFQLKQSDLYDLNKVFLLEEGDLLIGILADKVNDVVKIDFNELDPPLPVLTDIRANYTKGLTNGKIILNASQIINDKKLVINDK